MPKIIDCFPFFNELDMLELRLNELNDVVDHFVIVEALEMHGSSRKREAVLAPNLGLFEQFKDKITYILLPELKPSFTDMASGWARENYQRTALQEVAFSLATDPHDLIMVSDCDEIPSAHAVKDAVHFGSAGMNVFDLAFYYYNVNTYVSQWTRSTIGTHAQYVAEGGFQAVRDATNGARQYNVIRSAGWHFSYFGKDALAHVRLKSENFAHASDDICVNLNKRTDAEIAGDIANHRDIYRRPGMLQFQHRHTNDPSLPRYFLNNQERFEVFTETYFKRLHAGIL